MVKGLDWDSKTSVPIPPQLAAIHCLSCQGTSEGSYWTKMRGEISDPQRGIHYSVINQCLFRSSLCGFMHCFSPFVVTSSKIFHATHTIPVLEQGRGSIKIQITETSTDGKISLFLTGVTFALISLLYLTATLICYLVLSDSHQNVTKEGARYAILQALFIMLDTEHGWGWGKAGRNNNNNNNPSLLLKRHS